MTEEMKKCPYCDEEIMNVAIKCKYCGEFLKKDNNENNNLNNENDILYDLTLQPNLYMIFASLFVWCVVQPAWLCWNTALFSTKKSKLNYKVFNELERESLCVIPEWYPLSSAFANFLFVAIGTACNIPLFILLAYINLLYLSILEIKVAKLIEKHVYEMYGAKIKCNKVLTFIFQSIYLNYFLKGYKERVERATKNI